MYVSEFMQENTYTKEFCTFHDPKLILHAMCLISRLPWTKDFKYFLS